MANSKISALTSATTPLAGTETLPIVQSGATTKVTVANLTAGRSVTTGGLTSDNFTLQTDVSGLMTLGRFGAGYPWVLVRPNSTATGIEIRDNAGNAQLVITQATGNVTFSMGNLVQGTAAKGINFTANTALAGKTSQLLNYYEEGTWTVTLTPGTSGTIGLYTTFDECQYTRIGRMMFVSGQIKIISTSLPVGTYVRMSLPSTISDLPEIAGRMGSTVSKSNVVYAALADEGANYIDIQTAASGFAVDEIIAFSFAYVTA